ncbi:ion transporter [Chitinivorax sp. PXF-14]|uniref:ion transporter n=1 Tax=Chitinivorax sp. PXF-14 TaxID=3230488 RepID=UPI003464F074
MPKPTPLANGPLPQPHAGWRRRLYIIIFEADTRAGRLFDLLLIGAIMLSVIVVIADSVAALHTRHGEQFQQLEWLFTLLFSLEYLARLVCAPHPWRYATSFFGMVDLLSVLPTYLALLVPESHVLIDVRVLRLLRVFRILKLTAYVAEYQSMGYALKASARKIMVFLSAVLMIVVVMGTVLYVVEGPENGFINIPTSIYWAITTMTTVGFGDITPKTDLGRLISSMMLLLGWGTLAVPTGIVTVEMAAQRLQEPTTTRTCPGCLSEGHAPLAHYCMHCGERLPSYHADTIGLRR